MVYQCHNPYRHMQQHRSNQKHLLACHRSLKHRSISTQAKHLMKSHQISTLPQHQQVEHLLIIRISLQWTPEHV